MCRAQPQPAPQVQHEARSSGYVGVCVPHSAVCFSRSRIGALADSVGICQAGDTSTGTRAQDTPHGPVAHTCHLKRMHVHSQRESIVGRKLRFFFVHICLLVS